MATRLPVLDDEAAPASQLVRRLPFLVPVAVLALGIAATVTARSVDLDATIEASGKLVAANIGQGGAGSYGQETCGESSMDVVSAGSAAAKVAVSCLGVTVNHGSVHVTFSEGRAASITIFLSANIARRIQSGDRAVVAVGGGADNGHYSVGRVDTVVSGHGGASVHNVSSDYPSRVEVTMLQDSSLVEWSDLARGALLRVRVTTGTGGFLEFVRARLLSGE